MAGGVLTEEPGEGGLVLEEKHRHFNAKLGEVELRRSECDFAEFHCMLMREDVFRAPATFDEEIVCVHEHIHASLVARRLGLKTWLEPAAQITYLAFAPYLLADLPLFRRRWSVEAGESSIRAFAARWGVIDDERSFGPVRRFLPRHLGDVDPVRSALQDARSAQAPMGKEDLKQTLTELLEAAQARGYGSRDIERIREAYWQALPLFNGGYRPCGRPFINHAVGSASVLVHYGIETRVVQAALLHAAYTHAPHFDTDPHKVVREIARRLRAVGSRVEELVRAYSARAKRWRHLSRSSSLEEAATMSDVETALIAMANDAEMHLSGEVAVTGRTDVSDGPALSKAEEICDLLGVPGLALAAKAHREIAVLVPAAERPTASFRLRGGKQEPMSNPAFFQSRAATPVRSIASAGSSSRSLWMKRISNLMAEERFLEAAELLDQAVPQCLVGRPSPVVPRPITRHVPIRELIINSGHHLFLGVEADDLSSACGMPVRLVDVKTTPPSQYARPDVLVLVPNIIRADTIYAIKDTCRECTVIAWDWDVHLFYLQAVLVMQAADLFFHTHVPPVDYLSRWNLKNSLAGVVPQSVIQWPRKTLAGLYQQHRHVDRLEALSGGFTRYRIATRRNALVEKIIDEWPAAHVRFTPDMASYHQGSPTERFMSWRRYKTSVSLPVFRDLSCRFFDALAAGQVPIVPRDIDGFDSVIPPADQAMLPVIRLEDYTVEALRRAHAKAIAAFDDGGESQAEIRHRYVLSRHMLADRIKDIAARTADRFGLQLQRNRELVPAE
jgi:hypothetical protein